MTVPQDLTVTRPGGDPGSAQLIVDLDARAAGATAGDSDPPSPDPAVAYLEEPEMA